MREPRDFCEKLPADAPKQQQISGAPREAAKDEVRVVSGTLDRYRKRGWCRVETVAAFCPKRFEGSGEWRPPPLGLRYHFHHDPEDAALASS